MAIHKQVKKMYARVRAEVGLPANTPPRRRATPDVEVKHHKLDRGAQLRRKEKELGL